jgi:hypothetical protein
LQTVRFDDAAGLGLDMAQSEGVLGARRTNGSLYVALDPAVERSVVTLRAYADTPAPPADASPVVAEPDGPTAVANLVSSRWVFSGRTRLDCGFEVTAQGYGPGQMLWRTTARQAFRVSAARAGTVLWRGDVRSDDAGALALQVPPLANEPLSLRFECHD